MSPQFGRYILRNQNQYSYFLEPDGQRRLLEGRRQGMENGPYVVFRWALPHPAEKQGEVTIATSSPLLTKRAVTPTCVAVS